MLRGLAFISVLLIAGSFVCAADSLSPDDLAFFEKKVRPALIEHCYECHSEEAGKRKGGLWLDRKEGWQLGGDSGPALIPGDPDGSYFMKTIRYEDPDLEMPPDGKLPDDVIATFEQWIKRGAPDPRSGGAAVEADGMSIEEGKQFWSFRPRQNPEAPAVKTKDWPRDDIDRFILTELESAGLRPAKDAPDEALLRRAKVDLTGMQPTVEEQDEFLAEPSREKFAEMVDRWLASPDFGERWGRHWLDLARYSDSSGGGRAMPLPEAWRFRDHVVEAFRDDVPLDQLIRSHIAGDLLPFENEEERIRNLISTGFLVLGPHNYELQNKLELNLEIADEQMDTLGRAFMGMTIGCARCHDHKFDPIPTKDYYALAGIFLSTNSVTHSNVSKWHTEPIPPTEDVRLAVLASEKKQDELETRIAEIKEELATLGVGAGDDRKSVSKGSLSGIVIDDTEAEIVGEWQGSTSNARWVGAGYIHDKNEQKGGKSIVYRATIPEGGEYEVRMSYSAGTNRAAAVPVEVKTPRGAKSFVVNQKLTPAHDRLFHSLQKIRVEKGDEVVVTVQNEGGSGVVIADAVQWLPLFGDAKPASLPKADAEQIAALRKDLKRQEKELKDTKAKAPKVPQAMSVIDLDPGKIGPTELRIRGVEASKGEKVDRGFLQVAMWDGAPTVSDKQSGRLELANWMVASENPLTSRVLANRIWMQLMGRGIVPTADNFGVTGQAPSHPELLDYLAGEFIKGGWSAKKLIRRIILTRTYAMDSQVNDPKGRETDPENTLFWKAHRRALDVETMRDAMLVVSNELNPERGGASLPKGFKSEFGYQFTTKKRSVYVPVFRNAGHEMFSVFDFANPNFTVGKRTVSTIPTQALFLTNSPLVREYAERAAEELLLWGGSDEERVVTAFRKTIGRKPSLSETRMALSFLREMGDTEQIDKAEAWAALQKSLFACVDFRFLR